MKLKVISNNSDKFSEFIPNKNTLSSIQGVYLAGAVEQAMGYDCVSLVNYNEFDHKSKSFFTYGFRKSSRSFPVIPDGEYECEVVDYPVICKAFLWHDSAMGLRGLIVDLNDRATLQDAQLKYELKVSVL